MTDKSNDAGLFALVMALYAGPLAGSTLLLRELPAGWWGFFIALAPVLPGLWVAWSVAREIGARDELQRRIQLEALAFAFPATAVIALGNSLLEDNGVPRING